MRRFSILMSGGFFLVLALALLPARAGDAVVALNDAYVAGWKQDGTAAQQAALLPLFAEDAVVIPSGGRFYLNGPGDLAAFWFPDGAPPTTILQFDRQVTNVAIDGNLAVFHGSSQLRFEYDGRQAYQESYFLGAAKRNDAGQWQFTHLSWVDKPLATE